VAARAPNGPKSISSRRATGTWRSARGDAELRDRVCALHRGELFGPGEEEAGAAAARDALERRVRRVLGRGA